MPASILAAMLASASPSAAPLPPEMPWHGRSERLVAKPGDAWITPAETSGFTLTPTYDETRAWIDKLVAASPLLRVEAFGRSAQGRPLYAVIAHKGGADAKKPVLLVQAGIHPGEIDGKDAGLMLLRDIAFHGKDRLLDHADLLFVPIFNADGHERSSAYNRPNQRGPENQGWRTNAENLNLNRDYLKADTPEMRAMLALIQRYDPSLYLDLHVTDGSDYQYDVTFEYNGWHGLDTRSPAIAKWLNKSLRPAELSALVKAGHLGAHYFELVNPDDPDAGISELPQGPRYQEGWADTAHMPAVLVETHSLKSYRRRVLAMYVFIETALETLGRDAAANQAAIAADRASRPSSIVLDWRQAAKPAGKIDFKGIAHTTYMSPATDSPVIQWLGRPVTIPMDVYQAEPGSSVSLPQAYWVPVTKPDVIARLKLQGVAMETVTEPRTVDVDMVRVGEPRLADAFEGHIPVTFGQYRHERHRETFPPGSVRISTDQPLGLIAAMMLEPESSDSLLSWNFFPEILQRTEYMEPYVLAPMADRMLAGDAGLKAQFEAKLKSDPAFARDREKRLSWFYERSPYYDDRYLLYPVGREVSAGAS